MAIKIKNGGEFVEQSKAQIYRLFLSYLPQFQILAQQQVQISYNSFFIRNPKDTGTSEEQTQATVKASLRPNPFLRLRWEITKVDYAIFFLEPLQAKNPNFKYGKRNTLQSSRDLFAKEIGIN
jgi:hypothetical protein